MEVVEIDCEVGQAVHDKHSGKSLQIKPVREYDPYEVILELHEVHAWAAVLQVKP